MVKPHHLQVWTPPAMQTRIMKLSLILVVKFTNVRQGISGLNNPKAI